MMGAAIFSGPNLISFGFNNYNRTHPDSRGKDFDYSTHAEHAAILKIQHYDNKKNLIMYIYRETSFGVSSSKPCKMCFGKLRGAGIKRVRYFDENGTAREDKI
jgi:tRNA(Arg) A34 adenosine deaminase TadA